MLTARDFRAFAAGIRHEIKRCKEVCTDHTCSGKDFHIANKKLDYLPLIEGTAQALAARMDLVEAIELFVEDTTRKSA